MVYNLIRLKRAYEPAGDDGGYRILVERLWPRGAKVERWSAELRKWHAHDIDKWPEFKRPRQKAKSVRAFDKDEPVPCPFRPGDGCFLGLSFYGLLR